jgi:D-amino-acid dehydrogenase
VRRMKGGGAENRLAANERSSDVEGEFSPRFEEAVTRFAGRVPAEGGWGLLGGETEGEPVRPPAGVLIIGGGVIGVCSAYYLTARGREVILLDKGEICSGSSYGNAGLIVPSHSIPLAAPGVLGAGLRWLLDAESPLYIKPRLDRDLSAWLWQFRAACSAGRMHQAIPVIRDLHRASVRLYEELSGLEGLDFAYRQNGVLMLFVTEHGYESGRKEAKLLGQYGIESRMLDCSSVREMVPHVMPEVIGGLFYPEDAHVIPAKLVTGLARVAQSQGAQIRPETEVLGFEVVGRRITAVQTTRGDFRPEVVVLAGGSWSAGLAKELGLRLPIQPAKGYSITMKRPATCPPYPLNLKEAKVAATPMGDTMRLAGTLELAGLDLTINRRRVDAILKGARRYIEGLEEPDLIEIWRGLRPCTPDGLPIIERSSAYENLIIAAGHSMIGVSLGPITGKLVSQLVFGEVPTLDLGPLRLSRFRASPGGRPSKQKQHA